MTLEQLLWLWIGAALLLLPIQIFVVAPYGRHVSGGWGPMLHNTLAWMVMESVALVAFWIGIVWNAANPAWLPATLWTLHYVHRAWIYPLRAHTPGRRMPVLIMLFAVTFNMLNGLANGWYAGAGQTPGVVQVIAGLCLFAAGMVLNLWADTYLIRLRRLTGQAYLQPDAGLFSRISCPNHLGEIVQWAGFALLSWNLAALAFWIWTVANLLPRSLAHHRWYRAHFADYPPERRALIPYLL